MKTSSISLWKRLLGLFTAVAAAAGCFPDKANAPNNDVTAAVTSAATDECPAPAPLKDFHLTARPWAPLALPRDRYLDRAQAVATNMMQYQDAAGAIIDPDKGQ